MADIQKNPSPTSSHVACSRTSSTTRDAILIVEDDAVTQDLIAASLRNAGWACMRAGSAEAAVELLEQGTRPRMMLIDIGLPGMSGLALAQRMQNDYPSIPFIVLTAHEDDASLCASVAVGALSFLLKPVDSAKLGPIVRAALARHDELVKLAKTVELDHSLGVAAGILMRTHRITESAAMMLMQQVALSMETDLPLVANRIKDSPQKV